MAFPASPTNNQVVTVNNIAYIYSSASNSWTRTVNSAAIAIANTTLSTSTTTGALTVVGGIGTSGNVNVNGYGYFGGVFNETSTTGGVFAGNTGSGTPSPRIGFFNGTAAQNWQIDNYGGDFRWFTPGTTRMNLTAGGSLSVNTNVASTTISTGALVLAGGAGIAGNLNTGGYSNHFIATGSVSNTSALNIMGNVYGQGGLSYFDFLSVKSTYSGVTNPNKYFRLDSAGSFQIINSSYGSNIFNLTDSGALTVPSLYVANGVFWSGNSAVFSTGGGSFNGGTITGALNINNSTAATSTSTGALIVAGGVGVSGNVWAGQVYATNNGNGTNYAVGDDLWIGDINVANTTGLKGQQDPTQAYIVFGNSNTTNYIGRSGTNPITVTGAFSTTGSTTITSSSTSTSPTSGALVVTGGLGVGGNIYLSGNLYSNNTVASSITSVLTHGSDINFQLSAQNGIPSNATSTEAARFGLNYAGVGWDSYISFIRGSSSQNGSMTLYAGNAIAANISATNTTFAGNITSQWNLPSANVTYNLGATTAWWNNIYGTATHALYADLAENYVSDENYEPGTVVVFGGDEEVTTTNISHDTRVAGVISTNPAYLMNGALENGAPVAFTGRVPCLVHGPVVKGDVLVTSEVPGVAQKIDNSKFVPGCVLGKSLGKIETNEIKLIEVVVGRF